MRRFDSGSGLGTELGLRELSVELIDLRDEFVDPLHHVLTLLIRLEDLPLELSPLAVAGVEIVLEICAARKLALMSFDQTGDRAFETGEIVLGRPVAFRRLSARTLPPSGRSRRVRVRSRRVTRVRNDGTPPSRPNRTGFTGKPSRETGERSARPFEKSKHRVCETCPASVSHRRRNGSAGQKFATRDGCRDSCTKFASPARGAVESEERRAAGIPTARADRRSQ